MLNVAGQPIRWLEWQGAALAYCRSLVRWEAGSPAFTLKGGTNASTGRQSQVTVNSIIAVGDRSGHFSLTPALTNPRLFERDAHTCMYCGSRPGVARLSRDHVYPRGRGGKDRWDNVVTACRRCNGKKGCRTPEEAGMKLLAVPYAPSLAEQLLLSNRQILADQMAFLGACSPRSSVRS